VDIDVGQSPIVYSPDYDVTFAGIEKWYPLDTTRGAKIIRLLTDMKVLTEKTVIKPKEATNDHLSIVHSLDYLQNIKSPDVRARGKLPEVTSLALLPWFIVNGRLLRPMRFQVGGSVLAAKLALDFGWSINLGGGFTHCCRKRSGGYSAYDDVTMTLTYLLGRHHVDRVMIVDLSAQQCNGPERTYMNDDRVYIADVYNNEVYPMDGYAKRGINCKGEIDGSVTNKEYLDVVRSTLEKALDEMSRPDVVVYVAGSDVISEDAAGNMNISVDTLVERDQIVFLKIRSRGIPLVMLLGGGFSRNSHVAVAKSIYNLQKFGLISITNPSGEPNGTVGNPKKGKQKISDADVAENRDVLINGWGCDGCGVLKSRSGACVYMCVYVYVCVRVCACWFFSL
ncbi:hypothetical protein HELRODRAFT_74564, partial [Helobdella robusta]|uniref:Histone deacetylase domain-containing protein n=1 Tax=Helobdella robusta TaxID=6412 RepID=T1G1S8_HELRO